MADAFVAHASTGAQVQSVQPQQTLADDDDGLNRKQEGAAAGESVAKMLQMNRAQ